MKKIDYINKERLIEVNKGRTLSLLYEDAIPRNLMKSAGGIWRQLVPKQIDSGIKNITAR